MEAPSRGGEPTQRTRKLLVVVSMIGMVAAATGLPFFKYASSNA